jgi:hypothetical protein
VIRLSIADVSFLDNAKKTNLGEASPIHLTRMDRSQQLGSNNHHLF